MNKLSFLVGNGNMGYMLEMCVMSCMEFNAEYIDEIIIADNSSTDYSLEFFAKNPYRDITKIVAYDNPVDRSRCGHIAYGTQWDIGLDNCKNEYALLSHVDVQWINNYLKNFFDNYYTEKPFLFGYGGGEVDSQYSRIHEWGMIIHIPTWKQLGISFGGCTYNWNDKFYHFDTASFIYHVAKRNGMKIISLGGGDPDNTDYFTHYISGSAGNFERNTNIAKAYLGIQDENIGTDRVLL